MPCGRKGEGLHLPSVPEALNRACPDTGTRPLPNGHCNLQIAQRAGRWPNPGRMAGLDGSNGDNVAEIERALLKMVKLDIPGLAATAGG